MPAELGGSRTWINSPAAPEIVGTSGSVTAVTQGYHEHGGIPGRPHFAGETARYRRIGGFAALTRQKPPDNGAVTAPRQQGGTFLTPPESRGAVRVQHVASRVGHGLDDMYDPQPPARMAGAQIAAGAGNRV